MENQGIKRKRNPKKIIDGKEVRKRYSKEELVKLATWLAANPQNNEGKGVNKNKESTICYLRRMFKETGMHGVSDDSMRNAFKKINETYHKALNWANQTGQGVEEKESFDAAILEICPYFFILHKDFGQLQQHNTSYTVSSGVEQNIEEIFEDGDGDGDGVGDGDGDEDVTTTPVDLLSAPIIIDNNSLPTNLTFSDSLIKRTKKSKTSDGLYGAILEKEQLKRETLIEIAKIKEEAKEKRLLAELKGRNELKKMEHEFQLKMLEAQQTMTLSLINAISKKSE